VQGRDRGDLHLLAGPRRESSLDDAVVDTYRAELGAGLLNKFAAMSERQNAPPVCYILLDEGGGDHGLAAARWRDQ
jgi:hypothetical protein